MPIYKATIVGETKSRLVRADTAVKARDHLVTVESITADELDDLVQAGATIERAAAAVETPKEPAAQGELNTTGAEPAAQMEASAQA